MKCSALYRGIVLERAPLHMRELRAFFLGEGDLPHLPRAQSQKVRKEFRIKTIAHDNGRLIIQTGDGFMVALAHDGTCVYGKQKSVEYETSLREIQAFYETRLQPVLDAVRSEGEDSIQQIIQAPKDTYVFVKALSSKKKEEFSSILGDQLVQYEQEKTYEILNTRNTYVLISKSKKVEDSLIAFIEERTFLRSLEEKLTRLLNLQREGWKHVDSIATIKKASVEESGFIQSELESYALAAEEVLIWLDHAGESVSERKAQASQSADMAHYMSAMEGTYDAIYAGIRHLTHQWSMIDARVQSLLHTLEFQIKRRMFVRQSKVISLLVIVALVLLAILVQLSSPIISIAGLYYAVVIAVFGWTCYQILISKKIKVNIFQKRKEKFMQKI